MACYCILFHYIQTLHSGQLSPYNERVIARMHSILKTILYDMSFHFKDNDSTVVPVWHKLQHK